MLGTIVNVITIITGSLLGILLKKGIKDGYKDTIMTGVALAVSIIGISGGMKSENTILIISSLAIGSLIGEIIGIEQRLNRLGKKLELRMGKEGSNFSKGFLTASLV